MQCRLCGVVLLMNSDLFQPRPNPQMKETCISWASQLTVVASKNMSWVYEKKKMLAMMQGRRFFEKEIFVRFTETQGFERINFADEVMNSNLEEEKSMLKAGLGIAQQPCTKLLHFTADEIQNMKGAEMVTKSDEQRVAEVKQKYGNKEFVRGLISADGRWLRRSYSNASRSPCGQALIIGSLTRKVIALGFRVMKCSRENTVHACAVNHLEL